MDQFTWKISKCQSHSQGIETGISDDDELKCPHDRQVEEMKGGIWFGDADDADDDDDDPSESDVMQGACPRKTSHHCTSHVA